MEETIGCKTVQQLETFLQEEYHAQPVEPVDYLLYNARQQMLNLFYPQQMQQLAEQIGFGPESDEEVCALFDCLTETFDRETAGSRYVQYRFTPPRGRTSRFLCDGGTCHRICTPAV